mmetsp:Transcript_119277/g.344991  ORF Transcript_119277/g.344991 Transcript_119277/m.344991 type:complete len:256 (-) Transcript_119277:40-807(-)
MSNSNAIQLNNKAIDAISGGDLASGFQILLKACADQNRMSKLERTKPRENATHHSTLLHSGNHNIFEYTFEDCSNQLLLPSFQNGSETPVTMTAACRQKLGLLNLKYVKINSMLPKSQIDKMCRCGVSWVIGYNLSIICGILGLQLPQSKTYLLRRSLALLGPIHRTILKRRSHSTFWSTLKIAVLNNYAFVLKECSMETRKVILAMEVLLQKAVMADKVEPQDADSFQYNLQRFKGVQARRPIFEYTISAAGAA